MWTAIIAGLGTLFGAFIGSLPGILSGQREERRWKIEKRLELLQKKREELRNICEELKNTLHTGIQGGAYNDSVLVDAVLFLPNEVQKLLQIYFEEKDQRKKFVHYLNIITEAKKSIGSVDGQIDELLNGFKN